MFKFIAIFFLLTSQLFVQSGADENYEGLSKTTNMSDFIANLNWQYERKAYVDDQVKILKSVPLGQPMVVQPGVGYPQPPARNNSGNTFFDSLNWQQERKAYVDDQIKILKSVPPGQAVVVQPGVGYPQPPARNNNSENTFFDSLNWQYERKAYVDDQIKIMNSVPSANTQHNIFSIPSNTTNNNHYPLGFPPSK